MTRVTSVLVQPQDIVDHAHTHVHTYLACYCYPPRDPRLRNDASLPLTIIVRASCRKKTLPSCRGALAEMHWEILFANDTKNPNSSNKWHRWPGRDVTLQWCPRLRVTMHLFLSHRMTCDNTDHRVVTILPRRHRVLESQVIIATECPQLTVSADNGKSVLRYVRCMESLSTWSRLAWRSRDDIMTRGLCYALGISNYGKHHLMLIWIIPNVHIITQLRWQLCLGTLLNKPDLFRLTRTFSTIPSQNQL